MANPPRALFYLTRLPQVLLAPYQVFFVYSALQERFHHAAAANLPHPHLLHRPALQLADHLVVAFLLLSLLAAVATLTLPALDLVSARRTWAGSRAQSRQPPRFRAAFEEVMIVLWLLSGVGAIVTADPDSSANTPLAVISFAELLLFALSVGLVGEESAESPKSSGGGSSSSRGGGITLPEGPAAWSEKSFRSGDIVAGA